MIIYIELQKFANCNYCNHLIYYSIVACAHRNTKRCFNFVDSYFSHYRK